MNRRRLDELAERVAALESQGAAADRNRLDARLQAIEDAIGRLTDADPEGAEDLEAARRCNQLVADHVPAGAQVAVVAASDAGRLALDHWPTIAFRKTSSEQRADRGFDCGLAAIARLEAQRAADDAAFLLVPEPARAWLEDLPDLAEHLRRRYRLCADEAEAGLLFDIAEGRAEADRERTFAQEVERLVNADGSAPILDWTGLDLASAIPGRNVFVPPAEDGELPHLDSTVAIVIVEDTERLAEARRVASGAVVRVGPDGSGGVEVLEVEESGAPGGGQAVPVRVVIAAGDPEDRWPARVEEALAGCAADVITGPAPWELAAEAEMSVVIEHGIVPLPGCIEALADTLGSNGRAAAATAKLIAGDGSMEAAGRSVFADGSVAGMAAGCGSIEAPWHEYVRPVCAASGILGVRGEAAERLRRLHDDTMLAASAALWAGGRPLVYQPRAHAVRALGAEPGGDERPEAGIKEWEAALPTRPQRPIPLDERAWRVLLARDDPGEAWE
jgi:hypothetical protein